MKVTQKIATLLQILLAFCACTDNIIPVKVESVIINKEELTITEGERKALTATVLPENAENQTVYWSSNKNDVATVEDGVVTAISPGTAIITAISDDGGRKALCVVTVVEKPISVTGLSLDRENARVFINGSLTLVASILPADATNKTLLWKSDDESVATVADGVVTGIALGRTSIWVETEDGAFKAECVIDVVEERQTQSKGPMTLDLGKVTATTAVLSGVLDIDLTAGYDMTGGGVGFIYAPVGVELSVDSAQKVQITNVDYANGFSKTLTGLQRDTEYQYTIFLYKNNICQYGKTQTFRTKDAVITVDNVAVTYTTATLSGKVEREECDVDVKVGIQYSTDEDFSSGSTMLFEVVPEDGAYSKIIENLEINTIYYFRAYTLQKNVYKFGESVSFTTTPIDISLSIKSVTVDSVSFTGSIYPVTALEEISVCISVFRNNFSKNYTLKISDVDANGIFIITMASNQDLSVKTGLKYNYDISIKKDEKCLFKSEVKSFKTIGQYDFAIKDLNMLEAKDLCSFESANCYVVSTPGIYKFKTVKGNSNRSVGAVDSATILWETFGTSSKPQLGELIHGVCYKDGYIAFQVTDVFKKGNAVLIAKDENGDILWSWHIWLTDEPKQHNYNNDIGIMMDRNLGATTANPGDVSALGLLYQWGRKDPFWGASSVSMNTRSISTIGWGWGLLDPKYGTIEYTIANPQNIILDRWNELFDGNWLDEKYNSPYLWTTSKTIYDPCPVGWRVPDGGSDGVWSKVLGSNYVGVYDSINSGVNFFAEFGGDNIVWYPASGEIFVQDGILGAKMTGVGKIGRYWTCLSNSDGAYCMFIRNDGTVNPLYTSPRISVLSVRCQKQ